MRRQVKAQVVRVFGDGRIPEQVLQRRLEPHRHLAGGLRQPFARAKVPGHAAPARRVDMQPDGAIGFDVGVRRDIAFVAIAFVLAAQDVGRRQRAHRIEDVGLLAVHRLEAAAGRRLHRQQGDDLEQVVLHHVAQAARAFVERAPALDAEGLGQGDLHAGDVVAVPHRFEDRIGESEVQDVHDRFLAQEVVDAEDRVLFEHLAR